MGDIEILWRGLTLGGDTDIDVHEITGWDDLDHIDDSLDQARSRGHGDHPGEMYSRARIVTVRGAIASRALRDSLASSVLAVTPVSSDVEELAVSTFGQTLTAGARLLRRSLPVGEDYASGHVPFALQFKCPDPLRYGLERLLFTGLPTAGTGLSYPLSYGTPAATGRITLSNPGTAAAAVLLEVTGAFPQGFETSADGQRIRYTAPVPGRQVVTIDTGAGTVLAEGTADRRGELTLAEWFLVPADGVLTVQLSSLGGAADGTLTARWAPTYW
jgi:hypothetical protein